MLPDDFHSRPQRKPERESGRFIIYVVNIIALIGQVGTAITLMVLTISGTTGVSFGLTQKFLAFKEIADDQLIIESGSREAGKITPGWILVAMCWTTSLAHAFILVPMVFRKYYKWGKQGFNVIYWVEYIFTSSMMMFVLLVLTGVNEIVLLIGLSALIGLTNAFGGLIPELILYYENVHQTNVYARYYLPRWISVWLPFGFSTILSLIPWVVWLVYFVASLQESEADIPFWLWGAFVGTFFTFNAFAFVFASQRLAESRKWAFYTKRPWIFLMNYALLSLTSKLYLTWFFAGGLINRSF